MQLRRRHSGHSRKLAKTERPRCTGEAGQDGKRDIDGLNAAAGAGHVRFLPHSMIRRYIH